MCFSERVLELVKVLAIDDVDRHFAGKPNKLAGAGVRHYSNRKLRGAAVHGAAVLQRKGAAATFQLPINSLHRYVSGRAFDFRADRQHLSLAGTFELTVELL